MRRAIGIKLGKLVEVNHGNRKKRLTNGDNRRELKLKKEIKQLRQVVAKVSNELYRRRMRRKATKKEKKIIKELKASIGKETTSYNLRNAREQWLDTLRYKNIKLANVKRNKGENKTMLCSNEIRKDSSEHWKEMWYMKEKCQKWKNLSRFGEVSGKEKK